jgi:hypothetical protein
MPALIEQLWLTEIRIATEGTEGSGTATGDWYRLPSTGAALERQIITSADRKNVHRQQSDGQVICQQWGIKTSHEASQALIDWILLPELTDRSAGVWTLDPEAEGQNYVIETQSETGDSARYCGCRVKEISIRIEERRIVMLEILWAVMKRIPIAETSRTLVDLDATMMPTSECALAVTTGEWDIDPRDTQATTMHGGQIILTREIGAANFGPTGNPETQTLGHWKTMIEIYMPETPGVTDSAFADSWSGKIALWIGSATPHIRMDRARGFIGEEDLLAWDWRVRRLVALGESDSRRALIEFRA